MDNELIGFAVLIGGLATIVIVIGPVTSYLANEQNNAQQVKVLSTFTSSGSSACSYKLGLNQDYDSPCPYHTGDNITVYQNGFGAWHIKTTGVVGN